MSSLNDKSSFCNLNGSEYFENNNRQHSNSESLKIFIDSHTLKQLPIPNHDSPIGSQQSISINNIPQPSYQPRKNSNALDSIFNKNGKRLSYQLNESGELGQHKSGQSNLSQISLANQTQFIQQPQLQLPGDATHQSHFHRQSKSKTYQRNNRGGPEEGNDWQQQSNVETKGKINLLQQIKIRKILENFLCHLPSRRYSLVERNQFKFINDSLIISNNEETTSQLQPFTSLSNKASQNNSGQQSCTSALAQVKQIFKTIFNHIPLIDPMTKLSFIIDVIMLLTVLIYFLYIPIHLTFEIYLNEMVGNEFAIMLPVLYFSIDAMQLFTCYYDKGKLVRDRKLIVQRYIHDQFYNDLVPLLSIIFHQLIYKFEIYTMIDRTQDQIIDVIICVMFLFKYISFNNRIKQVKDKFSLKRSILRKITLFKLLFTILIIAHYLACLWCFIGLYEKMSDDSLNTWLEKAQITSQPWYIQYLNAYYFSTVTMITIGYGDITPVTSLEKLTSILTMLLSCGVFGYTMNSIGVIVQEFNKINQILQEKLIAINHFMHKKNISRDLQFQIREYVQYFEKEQDADTKELEQKVIGNLSEPLRKALLFETNKNVLSNVSSPIFQAHFSEALQEQIISIVQEFRCQPKDVIIKSGNSEDVNDNALYFIEKGQVDLFYTYPCQGVLQKSLSQVTNTYAAQIPAQQPPTIQKVFLQSIKEGQPFNTFSFFTGLDSNIQVQCQDYCVLLTIKRRDFLELLENFPRDYEIFCQIKDCIAFNNDFSQIKQHCLFCQCVSHDVVHCPYIHFQQKVHPLVLRDARVDYRQLHRQPNPEERCLQKYQTIINLNEMQDQHSDFIQDYEEYINNSHWHNLIDEENQNFGKLHSLQWDPHNGEGQGVQHNSEKLLQERKNNIFSALVKQIEGGKITYNQAEIVAEEKRLNNLLTMQASTCNSKQDRDRVGSNQQQQQWQQTQSPLARKKRKSFLEIQQRPRKNSQDLISPIGIGNIRQLQLHLGQPIQQQQQQCIDGGVDAGGVQDTTPIVTRNSKNKSNRDIVLSDDASQKSLNQQSSTIIKTIKSLQEQLNSKNNPEQQHLNLSISDQFDRIKNFAKYFPEKNFNKVIEHYKRSIEKNRRFSFKKKSRSDNKQFGTIKVVTTKWQSHGILIKQTEGS